MNFTLILLLYLLSFTRARFVKRVIGGTEANTGEFYNMATVYGSVTDGAPPELIGVGIIYDRNWIIVAGNCSSQIDDKYPLKHVRVIVGKSNLTATDRNQQMRKIRNSYTHHHFDPNDFRTSVDLGFLELEGELRYAIDVGAIRISSDLAYPTRGTGIVLGWGVSNIEEMESGQLSDILKYIEVEIQTKGYCTAAIQLINEMNHIYYPPDFYNLNHMCTGNFLTCAGPSKGDIGGPLLRKNERGLYEVIGLIIAWPTPIGCKGPTFYIRLSRFVSWFESMAHPR